MLARRFRSLPLLALPGLLLAQAPQPAPAPPAQAAPPAQETPAAIPPHIAKLLHPCPEGFTQRLAWNVAFLRPKGWTEGCWSAPGKPSMEVLIVSPKPFSATRPFETGFTIQRIDKPRKTTGRGAYDTGLLLHWTTIQARRAAKELLVFEPQDRGTRKNLIWSYRDAPAGQTPIKVHKFMVADERDDVLYIFTFECPEKDWEERWKAFGYPIFNELAVLPEALVAGH